MERDPRITKLFRESGLEPAPGNFTVQVMDKIGIEIEKSVYKPLIGKAGRFLIILFIIGIVVVSVIYSEPGGMLLKNVSGLSNLEWQLPQFNLNFDFLSEINLSTRLVSTLVAVFLLVLADAGFKRRNLV